MPSGIKNCHTKHKTLLNPKLTLLKWTKAFNNLLKWQNFGKSGRTGSNATHHNPFESWCSDLSLSFFSFQPNSLSLSHNLLFISFCIALLLLCLPLSLSHQCLSISIYLSLLTPLPFNFTSISLHSLLYVLFRFSFFYLSFFTIQSWLTNVSLPFSDSLLLSPSF